MGSSALEEMNYCYFLFLINKKYYLFNIRYTRFPSIGTLPFSREVKIKYNKHCLEIDFEYLFILLLHNNL